MKISNTSGLTVEFLENGCIKSIEAYPIRISLKQASLFSNIGANLYLRKRENPIQFTPILGPASLSSFSFIRNTFVVKGCWAGIEYTCTLQLSEKDFSWKWTVKTLNRMDQPIELDLVYLQDVGLKPATDGLVNEYYVSQYLERLILEDAKFGSVICCRQNTKESAGNPWLMLACKNMAVSAGTDGMQLIGKTYKETGIPECVLTENLGGEYAGESSFVALAEKSFLLNSGAEHESNFVATYWHDHPSATSANDLKFLPDLMNSFQDEQSLLQPMEWLLSVKNCFANSSFLPIDDLTVEELDRFFSSDRRHVESENNEVLSFFYGENNHVCLRKKEILADRPHGHIMQAQAGYEADENIVSTTSYAFGVFNSHVTQGNTNFNIFLSVSTSQFNHSSETGQRIFVEMEGKRYLLGVPSAFEMGLNHCRWIYKSGEYCFQVRSWTSKKAPQINLDYVVLSGRTPRVLVTNHFDESNGWKVIDELKNNELILKPIVGSMISEKFPLAQFRIVINNSPEVKISNDELLYDDQLNHGSSILVFDFDSITAFNLSMIGEIGKTVDQIKYEDADHQFAADCFDAQSGLKGLCMNLQLKSAQPDVLAINEIIPWFAMNAMTHFLTPHGLEQFGGAAWGTRDVSQGPFDFLLGMGHHSEAKKVLHIIFSNQNTNGEWPQWWMFDSYFTVRAGDCHGDVYYWCLMALSSYIKVTGDLNFLDEVLPYYHEKGAAFAEKTPLIEHVERLINMIVDSFLPGTALVPFGGGDWNDSLQPVSKELAQRLISSWTVEMNYQAFSEILFVFGQIGNTPMTERLSSLCQQIKSDFNTYLIKDGVVAGYGLLEIDGQIGVLLHPSDQVTPIKYSLLPMDRGVISSIFSKEQAKSHQQLIEQHLKGPDGARLMDRPLKYKGGIQTIFQRAESSTFFGREIGLMYVHEHIRFAESQAVTGNADAFLKALRQANPVDYRQVVKSGDIRQANCYYSSSDVAFKSRYEADDRYDEIKTGEITLRGGWRIYSSGPGIYITLIVSRLLGLRVEFDQIIIDPVLPFSMDGLVANLNLLGFPMTIQYNVRHENFSPKRILINGNTIDLEFEDNKFRKGGAILSKEKYLALLNNELNTVEIDL
jgi:cellobiose phosphorylase